MNEKELPKETEEHHYSPELTLPASSYLPHTSHLRAVEETGHRTKGYLRKSELLAAEQLLNLEGFGSSETEREKRFAIILENLPSLLFSDIQGIVKQDENPPLPSATRRALIKKTINRLLQKGSATERRDIGIYLREKSREAAPEDLMAQLEELIGLKVQDTPEGKQQQIRNSIKALFLLRHIPQKLNDLRLRTAFAQAGSDLPTILKEPNIELQTKIEILSSIHSIFKAREALVSKEDKNTHDRDRSAEIRELEAKVARFREELRKRESLTDSQSSIEAGAIDEHIRGLGRKLKRLKEI